MAVLDKTVVLHLNCSRQGSRDKTVLDKTVIDKTVLDKTVVSICRVAVLDKTVAFLDGKMFGIRGSFVEKALVLTPAGGQFQPRATPLPGICERQRTGGVSPAPVLGEPTSPHVFLSYRRL